VYLAQPGTRFGAEFLDQHDAGLLVRRQRLGLAAVPVQGQHELAVKALAQAMSRGQLSQFGDHLRVAAQVQIGVDASFQRLQPDFGQARDLPQRQRLRSHISQRLAPPQRQRRTRLVRRDLPGVVPGCCPRRVRVRPEPGHIHLVGLDPDQVTRRVRADPGTGTGQAAAQPHHMVLDSHPRRRRWLRSPHRHRQLVQ
jgi:hypothetical protein